MNNPEVENEAPSNGRPGGDISYFRLPYCLVNRRFSITVTLTTAYRLDLTISFSLSLSLSLSLYIYIYIYILRNPVKQKLLFNIRYVFLYHQIETMIDLILVV